MARYSEILLRIKKSQILILNTWKVRNAGVHGLCRKCTKNTKNMQQNPNFLKNCSVGFFLTEVPVFSTLIFHIGIENILAPSQDFALEAICEAKNSQNEPLVWSIKLGIDHYRATKRENRCPVTKGSCTHYWNLTHQCLVFPTTTQVQYSNK